jgi:hypothetical protein
MKKLLVFFVILTSCTKQYIPDEQRSAIVTSTVRKSSEIPDEIHFTAQGLYPEGVVFDRMNNRFLVSSAAKGTIGAVSYDGTYTPFIEDDDLQATIGMKIDEPRKQLVVVATSFARDVAQLRMYDLNTGHLVQNVDLNALRPNNKHFIDDVVLDPQGNKYVTDAESPIVYKVALNGTASVLFENEKYAKPDDFPFLWVGFNGIVYNKSGFLLVGFFAGPASLLKIPVNDPDKFVEVDVDGVLGAVDGLLISNDGKQLAAVGFNFSAEDVGVMFLRSDDKWKSAEKTDFFPTGFVTPTTLTSDGNNLYVMYSYLTEFLLELDSTRSEFIIKKVPISSKKF